MATTDLASKVKETADFIRSKIAIIPDAVVALGSGMNDLVKNWEVISALNYHDLPNFVRPTVASHEGKLLVGKMKNKIVCALMGRFHYYEGYSMEEITFPVRVMHALNVKNILFTNAAGGLNASYRVGDIVLIYDHIYLQPQHPLRGANDDSLGVRFPDQRNTYHKKWIQAALNFARKNEIRCHEGTYACIQGPTYETPAEYRYLKMIGGDVVGMSTIPEVIVAHYLQMNIACLSVIANASADSMELSHEEVMRSSSLAIPNLSKILNALLHEI